MKKSNRNLKGKKVFVKKVMLFDGKEIKDTRELEFLNTLNINNYNRNISYGINNPERYAYPQSKAATVAWNKEGKLTGYRISKDWEELAHKFQISVEGEWNHGRFFSPVVITEFHTNSKTVEKFIDIDFQSIAKEAMRDFIPSEDQEDEDLQWLEEEYADNLICETYGKLFYKLVKEGVITSTNGYVSVGWEGAQYYRSYDLYSWVAGQLEYQNFKIVKK